MQTEPRQLRLGSGGRCRPMGRLNERAPTQLPLPLFGIARLLSTELSASRPLIDWLLPCCNRHLRCDVLVSLLVKFLDFLELLLGSGAVAHILINAA